MARIKNYISSTRLELSEISKIFFPLAFVQIVQVSITLCANLALSHIGLDALASGGICNMLLQTGVVIVQSAISSFQPLLGQARGKGGNEGKNLEKILISCASFLSIILSLFLSALLFLIIIICKLYFFQEKIGNGAVIYMSSAIFSVPGMILFYTLRAYGAATGKSPIILKSVMCGTIFYILSSAIFIFFTKLSNYNSLIIMGFIFSLSWIISAFISFLSLGIYPLIINCIKTTNFSVLKKQCLDILKTGWPIGLSVASEMSSNTILAMFVGTIGIMQMNIHQLCQSLELLTFMPSLAMSQTVSARVSFYHGKSEPERSIFVHKIAIFLIIIIVIFEISTILIFHKNIYNTFINDSGYIANHFGNNLHYIFFIVSGIILFDALQAVSSGALRGVLDMKIPMLMAITSYWLVGFLFALIFSQFTTQPVLGVWIGIFLGVLCSSCLQTWRFIRLRMSSVKS